MSFKVNDKVICIEDCVGVQLGTGYAMGNPKGIPRKGELFTVSGINYFGDPDGLILVGCPALGISGDDVGWNERKFRKLEELQQESKERYYSTHHITITLPA